EKHTSTEIITEEEIEITDSGSREFVKPFERRTFSGLVSNAIAPAPRVEQQMLVRHEAVESKPIWKLGGRVVALSMALIVLTAVLVYVFVIRKSSALTATEVKSLAVLPFRPIGGESEDETLQLGIADTLITRLSNLREIKVRPTSAVLRYERGDYD